MQIQLDNIDYLSKTINKFNKELYENIKHNNQPYYNIC